MEELEIRVGLLSARLRQRKLSPAGNGTHFRFYNRKCMRTALDGKMPDEFYYDNLPVLPNGHGE